jgi:Skp1 family, tetramerisation domain
MDQTVTLVSSDGKEFKIQKAAAYLSGQISALLNANDQMQGFQGFEEQKTDIIRFKDIDAEMLQMAINYMNAKLSLKNNETTFLKYTDLDCLDSKKPEDRKKIEQLRQVAGFLVL